MQRAEGRVDVEGGRVWFARLGVGPATPLLMLHGGPGAAHGYIAPLAERLARSRPVIVYDQLGCGRSDRPDDPSLWTLDRAVGEVGTLRASLGLDECHLLGHSWGGWLAIECLTRGAEGIVGLVIASASASMAQYLAEIGCLVDAMPEPHRTALIELGAQGLYADPSYEAALDAFYRRHLCRLDPWPDVLVDGIDEEGANDAYRVMSGPNDLVVTGTLRTWDRRADLARITAPTLVTCGRYDEMTPACARTLVAGIPDARLAVFEDSGHVPHLDEPEPYADMVSAFLAAVDEYR